jgi:hypothetical protein
VSGLSSRLAMRRRALARPLTTQPAITRLTRHPYYTVFKRVFLPL